MAAIMSSSSTGTGPLGDWDCDCGWPAADDDFAAFEMAMPEFAFRPPPHFDLPPPPLPPSLQPPPELCSSSNEAIAIAQDTCQSFMVGGGGGGGGVGSDAEYQVPLDSPPSVAAIVVSAAILTAVIIIGALLFWRHRKQKEQQKMLLRCQQKTVANGSSSVGIGGMMDSTGVMPALLQGLANVGRGGGGGGHGHHSATSNDDNETVFYDELISYPTHLSYRPAHHPPPVYEMKDVLLKSSSPCHCTTTAHPLLQSHQHNHHQQHYVASPYHHHGCGGSVGGGSHSSTANSAAQSSSTTTTAAEQPTDSSGSWITEPVYEELPSGTEDGCDIRTPRDYRCNHPRTRNGSSSINVNDSSLRGSNSLRGGSVVRRPSLNGSSWSGASQETAEPAETDFFLAPTTWYQQHNNSMLRTAGQLTVQGPVRPGGRGGGIRAAWREIESEQQQQQQARNSPHSSSHHSHSVASGRKKRKIKSASSNGHRSSNAAADHQGQQQIYNNSQSIVEPYHTMGLYRGRCPPEEPPFTGGDLTTADDQELFDSLPLGPLDPNEDEPVTTPTKTLPRYYYYSESDDYGVTNRQRSLSGQRGQRHLSRNHRTQPPQQQPHRSPTFSDELAA